MAQKRIGKTVRPYLEKARESALLAIEIYNKPAISFRSAGYVSIMVIAWTALMHAIFVRRDQMPYYRHKNGRFVKIDGEFKHWELLECARQYWGEDSENAIRKNLEFFIPLRNKIEHRHIPALDASIFGECQAFLLNFDALLGSEFGARHQLRESLSFSLQLFPSGANFAAAVKANKSLADVKRFIDNYRSAITTEVMNSGQFAFKAFLIQVANHESADTIPIQFVNYNSLTDDQKAEIGKFAVLVKSKPIGVVNAELLKPSAVVKAVRQKLGNPMVERNGKPVSKFTADTHVRCWRHFKVRPGGGAKNPEETNQKFCIYDKAHGDYLYTVDWVNLLVEKIASDDDYKAIYA